MPAISLLKPDEFGFEIVNSQKFSTCAFGLQNWSQSPTPLLLDWLDCDPEFMVIQAPGL